MSYFRRCPECGQRTSSSTVCVGCAKAARATQRPSLLHKCLDCDVQIRSGRWCYRCYSARKASNLPLTGQQKGRTTKDGD